MYRVLQTSGCYTLTAPRVLSNPRRPLARDSQRSVLVSRGTTTMSEKNYSKSSNAYALLRTRPQPRQSLSLGLERRGLPPRPSATASSRSYDETSEEKSGTPTLSLSWQCFRPGLTGCPLSRHRPIPQSSPRPLSYQ